MSVQRAFLPDGRLHLQHGPIDLVIGATGAFDEVRLAYRQSIRAFDGLLEEIAAELPVLRQPIGEALPPLRGPVARRMAAAVHPFRGLFITPMAAVAGSVADHMLAAMTSGRRLAKAYVNDGGDIAFHLARGHSFRTGIVSDPQDEALAGMTDIPFESAVRGIATSGRDGRSFSLGIADSVTVLAGSAAEADAAATLIANAVDLPGHAAIHRAPANSLAPDSDLGDLPVTLEVGALSEAEIATALQSGLDRAHALHGAGHIRSAMLSLRARVRLCGAPHMLESLETP
ncbi:MAG: UPF0280 family protein [Alphaproteobacteria bacterium]|nr:UPF0280 family protein [Alphaproteobacteria bacterium]MBU0799127.1 UPF0280 family protein [Alphaproteobacteria bacterium]MBU0888844.1 UPF0280 family protein [Alphaproteobacteria bacterium]MBU1813864.1 UPF0280 family protein [Alphaproteobacteria bacterium]